MESLLPSTAPATTATTAHTNGIPHRDPPPSLRQSHPPPSPQAQFFDDLLAFALVAEADGKQLVVAGLDGDFKRQRFGQLLELLPLADSVTKLSGTCQFCGTDKPQPSVFTLRVSADERQELVGGADSYVPVCRK